MYVCLSLFLQMSARIDRITLASVKLENSFFFINHTDPSISSTNSKQKLHEKKNSTVNDKILNNYSLFFMLNSIYTNLNNYHYLTLA